MIHKSHSKNELVKIIEACEINIKNPRKYKKTDLSDLLDKELKLIDHIKPNEDLCIYNLTDLRFYLSIINPKKRLSIKEKNNVILICKKIKHLSRNSFLLSETEYSNMEEVYNDARYICEYGDIPSVRKAIRDLNQYTLLKEPFIPKISDITKKELDMKEKLKKTNIYKCDIKHGTFILTFD